MLSYLKQRAMILQCRVSIIDVFKHFGINLQSAGNGKYRCKATWRGGKNPLSVAVSLENNCFVDFGDSDSSGGVVKLYTLLSDYKLAEINEDLLKEICSIFAYEDILNMSLEDLNKELSSSVEGFKQRKVDLEVLKNKTKTQQIKLINSRYEKAKPLTNFEYFDKKSLPHNNLSGQLKQLTLSKSVEDDGLNGRFTDSQVFDFKIHKAIIVPMFDLKTQQLKTLSYFHDELIQKVILEKYLLNIPSKSIHYGIPIEGCGFIINKDNDVFNQNIKKNKEIFVAEGLATGLSIFNCFNGEHSVVITFGSSNVKDVCKTLTELYPESFIIFCADKDKPQINKEGHLISPVGVSILSGIDAMLISNKIAVIAPFINENEDNSVIIKHNNGSFSLKNNSNITDFNDIAAETCRENIELSLTCFIQRHKYFRDIYLNVSKNKVVTDIKKQINPCYYFLSFTLITEFNNQQFTKNLHIFNIFDKIKDIISNQVLETIFLGNN